MLKGIPKLSRMGKLYSFLGLSVGVVQEQHSRKRRRVAFGADVTYVTSNSLGFTYLGDTSTALTADELVMGLAFCTGPSKGILLTGAPARPQTSCAMDLCLHWPHCRGLELQLDIQAAH